MINKTTLWSVLKDNKLKVIYQEEWYYKVYFANALIKIDYYLFLKYLLSSKKNKVKNIIKK